jgi:hypothetical protein
MKNGKILIKLSIVLSLSFTYFVSFAQGQQAAVKGTRTDKQFANTTEIHKAEKASDDQVLAEIEGDYGLGDIVRISNAPPVAIFLPSTILPKTIESSTTKPLPILLPASAFKLPKTVVINKPKTDKTSDEKSTDSKGSSKKDKDLAGKNRNKKPDSLSEIKEKPVKKPNLAENSETGSSDTPSEKTEKTNTFTTSKNEEIEASKTKLTATEKKNTSVGVSANPNKKWMENNLAKYNSNKRTHRSASTRVATGKSWFPFFNKKRTSSMPKTVKNKKKDRCYQF